MNLPKKALLVRSLCPSSYGNGIFFISFQPSIWMKLAEIFEQAGEEEKCIDAYYKVLELAPLQASVRLTLATYLRLADRDEEAIAVLSGQYYLLTF